jgi:molecular chaperone Hsp33
MSDVLVRGIDRDAGLRVVVAVTTDLVREAVRRHQAEGLGACALGRALTSSLLLATLTKGGERVTLQLQGNGPLGGITADASDNGDVRGYIAHADRARIPCNGRGRVVEVLGRDGVVNVLRDLGLKERYQGQIPLVTGEVDEDVEGYLRQSEQVPSALGCDVVVEGGEVLAAGGVLVQALPEEIGVSDDPTGALHETQHALRIGALWDALRRGEPSARSLASAVYAQPIEFLDERPLRFKCRCTLSRVEDSLALLSTVELDEMIADPGHAEVTCNFCNERYIVGRDELEKVRATVAKGPRGRN